MNRSGAGGRQGFTLIEVTIAAALGLLLIGLVVGILWWALASFRRSEERLDPREKVHLALTALRSALGDAWHYRTDPSNASFTFSTPKKDGEIRYDRVSGAVSLKLPGQATFGNLITGLTSFRIESLRPGFIQVVMEVARQDPAGKLESLGPREFFEEIFMPAMGAREGELPWNPALERVRSGPGSL